MSQSVFLKRSLLDGEEVLYSAEIHFMFIVKAALIAILLTVLGAGIAALFRLSGLIPAPYADIPAYVLGGVGAGFFIWRLLWKATAEFVLTNKRFLLKHGVIFVQQSKLDIFGMDSCEIRSTVIGTWLDYGDILVSTLSASDGNPRLPSISRPGEFTKAFDSRKKANNMPGVIGIPADGA